MAILSMIKIRIIIIEKEKLSTKIKTETIQDTVKYRRSTINNHFNNVLKCGCITFMKLIIIIIIIK